MDQLVNDGLIPPHGGRRVVGGRDHFNIFSFMLLLLLHSFTDVSISLSLSLSLSLYVCFFPFFPSLYLIVFDCVDDG